jgi:hydroxypyruvate isomerase
MTMTEKPFQTRVDDWMAACFGEAISRDVAERNHRFIEEAIELVQAMGCPREDVHRLVDYVFNREVGEPAQEVGGVLVTLAALCSAAHTNMKQSGEAELNRIWGKVEQIRAKQAAKPKGSPLPVPS